MAHGQSVGLAECVPLPFRHGGETAQVLKGLDVGLLAERQDAEVLGTALDRIDEIMPDAGESLLSSVVVEDKKPRTLDLHIGRRVDQVYAVHGGRSALVELAGNVLHGDVFPALQRPGVGDGVGHDLAENAVAALLQQLVGESEKVIYIDEPQGLEVEGEVLVELREKARGLHPELFPLLHEYTVALHIFEKMYAHRCGCGWA